MMDDTMPTEAISSPDDHFLPSPIAASKPSEVNYPHDSVDSLDNSADRNSSKATLGKLTLLANQMSVWQNCYPPALIKQPKVLLFSADYCSAEESRSLTEAAQGTFDVIANDNNSVVRILARQEEVPIGLVNRELESSGTHSAAFEARDSHQTPESHQDLTSYETHQDDTSLVNARAQVVEAMERGQALADREVDNGTSVFLIGAMGKKSTMIAAAIVGTLTDTEPVELADGLGSMETETWSTTITLIRDVMFRSQEPSENILDLCIHTGGVELGTLIGFLTQAAVRRTPCILDGLVAASAAMIAERLAPQARLWWVAADVATSSAHQIALDSLELESIMNLEISLGDGSAALLCLPTLRAAILVAQSNLLQVERAGLATSETALTGLNHSTPESSI